MNVHLRLLLASLAMCACTFRPLPQSSGSTRVAPGVPRLPGASRSTPAMLPATVTQTSPLDIVPIGGPIVIAGVQAQAPHKLVNGPRAPELIWASEEADGIRLYRTLLGAGKTPSIALGKLALPSHIVQFNAARSATGVYFAALLLQTVKGFAVELFRSDERQESFNLIEEFGNEEAPVGEAERTVRPVNANSYASLELVVDSNGSAYLAWADGWRTRFAHVDSSGRVAREVIAGSGRTVALALDARERLHAIQVGHSHCIDRGMLCNDRTQYSERAEDHWESRDIGGGGQSTPLLVDSGESMTAAFAGGETSLEQLSTAGRRITVVGGRGEYELLGSLHFTWSKLIGTAGRTWLVATSWPGLAYLQAFDAGIAANAKPIVAPLLDLFSMPSGASHFDAIIQSNSLYLVYSTPNDVQVRRTAIPTVASVSHRLYVEKVGVQQLRLGNRWNFGENKRAPAHSDYYAFLRTSKDDDCIISLTVPVRSKARSVVLSVGNQMRILTPTSAKRWRLEEYSFGNATIGEPGEKLCGSAYLTNRRGLVCYSADCPRRQYASSSVALARTEDIELSSTSWWVSSLSDATYALTVDGTGARVMKVDLEKSPIGIEPLATIDADVEPSGLRLRRDPEGNVYIAYAVRTRNLLKLISPGGHELTITAEQGAFAFDLDAHGQPRWLVRRDSNLWYESIGTSGVESRRLTAGNALPVAMKEHGDGTLSVALRTGSNALITAFFSKTGEYEARPVLGCYTGQLAAEFYSDSMLAFACERQGP
ncbi:MAG TPA: hypothetical protein VIV60_27700 [Polyangiaceae bacterium]